MKKAIEWRRIALAERLISIFDGELSRGSRTIEMVCDRIGKKRCRVGTVDKNGEAGVVDTLWTLSDGSKVIEHGGLFETLEAFENATGKEVL